MRTKNPADRVAPKRTTPIRYAPKPRRSGRPAVAAKAMPTARATPLSATPASPVPRLVTRKIPDLESKIVAAGQDSAQILRTLDTELALCRAGREANGTDHVQALRVLSVAMLFTLLLAALGAMSYLQNQFVSHGFQRRPAAVSANPAPGPSAPTAGPDRLSARPTR